MLAVATDFCGAPLLARYRHPSENLRNAMILHCFRISAIYQDLSQYDVKHHTIHNDIAPNLIASTLLRLLILIHVIPYL